MRRRVLNLTLCFMFSVVSVKHALASSSETQGEGEDNFDDIFAEVKKVDDLLAEKRKFNDEIATLRDIHFQVVDDLRRTHGEDVEGMRKVIENKRNHLREQIINKVFSPDNLAACLKEVHGTNKVYDPKRGGGDPIPGIKIIGADVHACLAGFKDLDLKSLDSELPNQANPYRIGLSDTDFESAVKKFPLHAPLPLFGHRPKSGSGDVLRDDDRRDQKGFMCFNVEGAIEGTSEAQRVWDNNRSGGYGYLIKALLDPPFVVSSCYDSIRDSLSQIYSGQIDSLIHGVQEKLASIDKHNKALLDQHKKILEMTEAELASEPDEDSKPDQGFFHRYQNKISDFLSGLSTYFIQDQDTSSSGKKQSKGEESDGIFTTAGWNWLTGKSSKKEDESELKTSNKEAKASAESSLVVAESQSDYGFKDGERVDIGDSRLLDMYKKDSRYLAELMGQVAKTACYANAATMLKQARYSQLRASAAEGDERDEAAKNYEQKMAWARRAVVQCQNSYDYKTQADKKIRQRFNEIVKTEVLFEAKDGGTLSFLADGIKMQVKMIRDTILDYSGPAMLGQVNKMLESSAGAPVGFLSGPDADEEDEIL